MQLQNENEVSNQTDESAESFDLEISIEETNSESESNNELEVDEKNSRFKDGEIIQMIRVRFPGNAKSFPFLIGKRKFGYGQKVVAMSDRGMTVGYINSFPYDIEFNKSMLPIRSIAKVATEEDIKAQKDFRDSEKKAEVICLRLIEKHQLDMVLTHVEFIQFGKKAVFYFNAPDRVDFRELVKDLVAELKMRIELRQISVRDRAAALGAVGACGLQTCCSSFLKSYGNVSIKMAKNQNLALIPSKLNGVCGQIKCCIKYEDDVYADKRKNLPKEGAIVKAVNGDIGKVIRLHLLVEQFELLTDFGAKRRYSVTQFDEKIQLAETYRFPETFDHIVDETKEVIGLSLEEKQKAERFIETHPDQDELDEMDDEEFEGEDFDDQDPDDVNPYDNENESEEIETIVKEAKATTEEAKQITRDNHPRPQHNNRNNDQRGNRDNRDNRNQNRDNRQRPQNSNNQNNNQRRDQRPNNNQQRDNRLDNRNQENRNQDNRNNENRQQNRPHHNRNQENRQNNNQGERRPQHNRPNNNQQGQGQSNQGQGQSNQGQGQGQNRNNKNFKPRNHHNNQNRDNRNPNQQGQQAGNQQNNQRPNDKDKDQNNKKPE